MANVITYGTFDLFHVGHLRVAAGAERIVFSRVERVEL